MPSGDAVGGSVVAFDVVWGGGCDVTVVDDPSGTDVDVDETCSEAVVVTVPVAVDELVVVAGVVVERAVEIVDDTLLRMLKVIHGLTAVKKRTTTGCASTSMALKNCARSL